MNYTSGKILSLAGIFLHAKMHLTHSVLQIYRFHQNPVFIYNKVPQKKNYMKKKIFPSLLVLSYSFTKVYLAHVSPVLLTQEVKQQRRKARFNSGNTQKDAPNLQFL